MTAFRAAPPSIATEAAPSKVKESSARILLFLGLSRPLTVSVVFDAMIRLCFVSVCHALYGSGLLKVIDLCCIKYVFILSGERFMPLSI